MTDRELMQQALEVLIFNQASWQRKDETVNALRDRLAQSEQGPVAWQGVHDHTDLYYRKPPQADVRPLYTNPPAQPSPVLQQAYSTSAAYTVGFKDGQATQRQPVAWSAQPEVALQYPQDAVEWQKQQQLRAQQINAQSSGYAPRPWVGLTDGELRDIAGEGPDYFDWKVFGRSIENKLRERNT